MDLSQICYGRDRELHTPSTISFRASPLFSQFYTRQGHEKFRCEVSHCNGIEIDDCKVLCFSPPLPSSPLFHSIIDLTKIVEASPICYDPIIVTI
ncbi:hypothetical protein Ac2012v2_002748 [Leucoagaricus gongylophorus]